jgi:hypothetical protein
MADRKKGKAEREKAIEALACLGFHKSYQLNQDEPRRPQLAKTPRKGQATAFGPSRRMGAKFESYFRQTDPKKMAVLNTRSV